MNQLNMLLVNTLLPYSTKENGLILALPPSQASINLSYSLENRPLNLSIIEAQLQLPEKPAQSTVLFTAAFTYEIQGETTPEKQQHLFQLIDNYQPDLSDYKELVNNKFLGELTSPQVDESETVYSSKN